MGEPSVEGARMTGSFLTDPDSTGQRDILLDWPLITVGKALTSEYICSILRM